ncbi:hypothetical protein [Paraflavitalea speifideaquila]|uniref:hypothetical protein n=1 Tax=Paraflavitalea speifideaquila TaxID=3076558 RepID=UPI0028EC63B1|nr:hypothetical protein [Paraflavitalea speifideiaquila]
MLLVVLIIVGCIQQRKSWWVSGVIALSIFCLCCGGYLLYQQLHTGQAYYLVQGKKGIFLSNLILMEPFIVSGTINSKFYGLQLSNLFGVEYTTIVSIIRWLGLILAIVFTIVVSGYLIKKRSRVNNTQDGFFLFGFIGYISTIGLLALLSLIHDKYIGPPVFNWTYVQDARYFAFPAFFVQVCLWWYLFARPQNNKPLLMRWLKTGVVLLMVLELLHSMYLLAKKCSPELVNFRDTESERPEQAYIIRFIQEMQMKDPGRQVVVMSFEKEPGTWPIYMGHRPCLGHQP